MTKKIKLRATGKKGYTIIKAILFHQMETGLRKNKTTGEKIPAHFIKEVVVAHNDKAFITINMGIAVSKNPYLSVEVDGAVKGDKIMLSWVDNLDETASAEVTVS